MALMPDLYQEVGEDGEYQDPQARPAELHAGLDGGHCFFFGGFIISSVEGLPLADCLFETASAVGTVGLSLGLTPSLGLVSRGVLIFLMYMGRVGGLTLIYAALAGAAKTGSKLPQERITIG